MDLLSDLNSAQRAAATHGDGPLLIVAGAGTGKTTVITRRIAWLIEQGLARPEEILALTFTEKAASEMEERVDRLLPIGYVNTWISTFHAFGERILKDYGLEIGLPNRFSVYTVAQQWLMVYNNLARFELDYYKPLGNPTRFIHALLQHFSRAKDEEIPPAAYLRYAQEAALNTDSEINPQEETRRLLEVAGAYHVYNQLLLDHGAFDFGDLIAYTLKLVRTRPRALAELRRRFKYVLVDEFQDTNWAQYELARLLSAPHSNLTVCGDDDQSIYAFRGASMSNILGFKRDYPECAEVFLNENYRSKQGILDCAYKFIQLNNPDRLEVKLATAKGTAALSKKLVSTQPGDGLVVYQEYASVHDEAAGIAKKMLALQKSSEALWSDFAILVRANSSAPPLLTALKAHGIPFQYVANKGLYLERIVQEVLNYLTWLDSHHDSSALYKVLISEAFQMPHDDLVRLTAFAHQKTISLYDALKRAAMLELSESARGCIERLFRLTAEHTVKMHERSAAEVYVKVIHDLGIEERLAHPALARDAQYLAALYDQIRKFEAESGDHLLHAFLAQLTLELESGEEGTLPADYDTGPETVKLTTIHAAKGLEWRFVFLPQLIDRRFPSIERKDPIELPAALIKETLPEGDAHLAEERRLLYVALTRAKEQVYLTRAHDYLGKTTRRPSRFLYELGLVDGAEEKKKKSVRSVASIATLNTLRPGPARYEVPTSFSFTAVSTFRKCPLEYKFRYLIKLPAPGSPYLSFGNTIHKTLEEFLKIWQQRVRMEQGDLFGVISPLRGERQLPTFDELKSIYDRVWIDDWYDTASQKQEYREVKGPAQLKNFYDHFIKNPRSPAHLEAPFKIAMGPYKFVGKIDRIDAPHPNPSPAGVEDGPSERRPRGGQGEGVAIIDYKTGATTPKKLEKVDRDQLIIYQIAAQEFLKAKVESGAYWYLDADLFSEPFLASAEQCAKLRAEYTATIDNIVDTIQRDSSFVAKGKNFERAEAKIMKHIRSIC
ncbi:ATP-dependent helicase [Candidatus Uhrbacteria bacterium]|nr:ATP-dependent helicase [Candidatus Uhrbacteria bacterium]